MKKFFSLILTLCMILTVVSIPTVSFATESTDTVLYKMATATVGIDQSTFVYSNAGSDAVTSSGTGSITFDSSKSSGAENVTTAPSGDTFSASLQKNATDSPVRNAYYAFSSASVASSDTQKAVYTFKLKPSISVLDSEQSNFTTTDSGTRIEFDTSGSIDGTEKSLRAFWLVSSASDANNSVSLSPSRGVGASANGYEGTFKSLTSDNSGYHSIRIEVYPKTENDGKYIYSDVYDALTETKIGYHKFTYNNNFVIGNSLSMRLTMEGSQKNVKLDTSIKDFKAVYTNKGIGDMVSSNAAIVPTFDNLNDIMSVQPAVGGTLDPSLSVSTAEITTGNIVADFSIKTEKEFYTDETTASIKEGSRYFKILGSTSDANSITISHDGLKLDRKDGGTFTAAAKDSNYGTAQLSSQNDVWVPMRVVISRTDTTKGWSIAYYNLNTSTTNPVYISYAQNIGNFKGFGFEWYRPTDVRNASSTNPALPKIQQPLSIKNLVIKQTDTITNTSTYANYNNGSGSGTNKKPITVSDDKTTVKFVDTIYVRTKAGQSAKAYFVYNDNGTEHKVEKELYDGINHPVEMTISGLTNANLSNAKLYIYDGEKWLDNQEYVPASKTKIDLESVQSQVDGSTAVMRFIFKPTFDGTATKFGAYIIPYDLFTTLDASQVVNASKEANITSGSTYSADLTKIPENAYAKGIIALPYIVVDGKTYQSAATEARTVNDTNVQKQ